VLVPPVQGDTYAVAAAAIMKEGLVPKEHFVKPTVNGNHDIVTGTDPGPNRSVAPGTTVICTVPTGEPTVLVPKGLSGKSPFFAETAILNAHLQFQVMNVLSATVPKGLVTTTTPGPGAATTESATVTILVSEGPGVAVPPVMGLTANAAEAAITTAGLNPQEILQPSSAQQMGLVILQDPSGGTQVTSGSTVTITVGQGLTSTITVISPRHQRTPANQAVTVQIQAADSVPGRPLTFAVAGLPPGLIMSSTGLITGSSNIIGVYQVTVTVTDSSGASGSVSFDWTIK
jgi:beta-lactam-binding protein with PASTA domain